MRQQKFQSTGSDVVVGSEVKINGSVYKVNGSVYGASNVRPVPGVERVTELISPEIADQYLKHNTHNRPLVEERVEILAREMEAGRWQYNADTIRFDVNGVLMDGQTRLHAVKKSGFHMLVDVVRGLQPEAMATIDLQRKRSASDIMHLGGIKNSTLLSAIVRLFLIYENYDKAFGSHWDNAGPSQTEVSAYAIAHSDDFEDSVRVAYSCAKLTSPAVAGCCHRIFSRIDPEAAIRFFEDLTRSGAASTNPTLHLRERLLANKGNTRAKLERRYILALFFKAWSYYRVNRPMSLLRWATDGAKPEAFPTL